MAAQDQSKRLAHVFMCIASVQSDNYNMPDSCINVVEKDPPHEGQSLSIRSTTLL